MRLLEKLCSSNSGSSAPKPAFAKVLTPNRIPEFCIPPRLPAPCALESPSRAAALPRRCAAERDLWPRAADEDAGRTDWDPRSQAALSLPHLPRVLTAYGFCVLLESPHTRRKESLLLGDPSAPRPRTRAYGGGCGPDAPLETLCGPRAPGPATPAVPGRPRPPRTRSVGAPRWPSSARPDGLLSRALRARRSRRLARARSVSSGNEDKERRAGSQSRPGPLRQPVFVPGPLPERLEAEGTLALGRAGDALRLAAEYCPETGRLRLRLLRAEGLAGGVPGPRAVRCRLSLVLRPPDTARRQCSIVVGRSRKASFDQDFCFDGLSEDEVRRLAVRVKAWDEGRGRERGRLLGQGELSLGALLLL
nr:C2 calcium-dependent domain-containing protein 4B [Macaca nemestrina]XP_011752136.1 C2 calcium-dependent domain-containing protein 4B [Macaca nemestrina]XP_011752145.1 C2 calcium-dependent domain-containing protein 4B [Macaca nemestrina]XP_011752154.1 C2 calcium-dependent domain-containing protein 4B [Macaca nemestrina]XP_024650865.1 C2 calcium-dependent domain-containing protein 4B [Macaca nemestrina]